MKRFLPFLLVLSAIMASAQESTDLYRIIEAVSAERIERDIATLANFGTRHTLSDTLSQTRGIGAARRWIKVNLIKFPVIAEVAWKYFTRKTL